MGKVSGNPFLFRFCVYKKYHVLAARLEFYSVLKTVAPACSPPFPFSRSTGRSVASLPCLSAVRAEGLLALEQAPSSPASICRKEGEAQRPRPPGGASSSGEASARFTECRGGRVPPAPRAMRSAGRSPACGFFPLLSNAGRVVDLQERKTLSAEGSYLIGVGGVDFEPFEVLKRVDVYILVPRSSCN